MDENLRNLRNIFLARGIEVQAFIRQGNLVMNPWDIKHCWIVEKDYLFSVVLRGDVEQRITNGIDKDGKVTTPGGFWATRIEMDEEVYCLINKIGSIEC